MIISRTVQQRRVFFDGNSLSNFGNGSVANVYEYPTSAYNSLTGTKPLFHPCGVGSKRTTMLTADFLTKIAPICKPNDIVVFMEITNEARDGLTAQTMIDNVQAYCVQARTYGLKIVVCTCPAGKLTTDPSDTVTRELAANVILRNTYSTFADKLADVGAVTQLDAEADITNVTYYNADQLHLTSAGYTLIANAVYPKIQELL